MQNTIEQPERGASLPPASCSPKPVTMDERLVRRIGVREWGMPSTCMPGKIWRSEKHGTITCMTPHEDASKVKIETLPLVVIPAGEISWLPDSWRAALWEYVQAWPDSGHGLGPLLAITEEQRCDFIRNWAKKLAVSDNIGCCSIANAIGEFAAYGYDLSENNQAHRSAPGVTVERKGNDGNSKCA